MDTSLLFRTLLDKRVIKNHYLLIISLCSTMPASLIEDFVETLLADITHVEENSKPPLVTIRSLETQGSNGSFTFIVTTTANIGSLWLKNHAGTVIYEVLSKRNLGQPSDRIQVKALAESRAGC